MTTMDLKSELEVLSKLTYAEIGASEENVKNKIAVPLLKALGHNKPNDLDFEHGSQGKRIDIFINGLPNDSKIVIDTKKYNEDLNNHLNQICQYAFQERAILALFVNGEEIRIYDLFHRVGDLRDTLLFSIKRRDLAEEESIRILKGLLLKENILNRSIKHFIEKREDETEEANNKIESIKIATKEQSEKMQSEMRVTNEQIEKLQREMKEISARIDSLKEKENNDIKSIKEQYKLNTETNVNEVQNIEPYEMQGYRPRNVFSQSSDKVEIALNNLHTPKKYSLVSLPRESRHLFPGFKVEFELETDIGTVITKVTSGPRGTKYGDPIAGAYIQGGLKRWYDAHPELKNGMILVISVVEPQKRYSLSIRQ